MWRQAVEAVRDRRAGRAARLVVRAEHEVVDEQLRAPVEQLAEAVAPRVGAGLILVVTAPPCVGRGLRVALRRVLPLLLGTERREVEVAPRAAQGLGAAMVDEVRGKHVVAFAEEGVGALPL